MVEFKAPNHLMILIPAKMNSPDYDDFIDMFNVPTPILPLSPTPVASPSHEQSQDAIYDSLPPMEQSTVPESHLKEPMESSRSSLLRKIPWILSHQLFLNHLIHLSRRPMSKRLIPLLIVLRDPWKDEMRKDGTRNEGMRNEDHETPGCIEDPISNPHIEDDSAHILFKSIKEDSSRRFPSVHDGPNRCQRPWCP
ncbi:hypothetical protein TNCV_1728851 [Trichonephila clavipes]|nr:hypothetical protein TNCV_1728851 [Trichonephila clavipes]